MVCSVMFYFYKRKFHCYVCGDCVCKECCKGSLLITEFKEYGYVPACTNCAYGQVSHTEIYSILFILLFNRFAIRV
jgi:hypothetical protein